jgi:hypothetical protein
MSYTASNKTMDFSYLPLNSGYKQKIVSSRIYEYFMIRFCDAAWQIGL